MPDKLTDELKISFIESMCENYGKPKEVINVSDSDIDKLRTEIKKDKSVLLEVLDVTKYVKLSNLKLICVVDVAKTSGGNKCFNITIGKIYDVIFYKNISNGDLSGMLYFITNDNGANDWYHYSFFKTLSEYRDQKIKELGI